MPFGRKSPLEALALPGVMLAYKYSQFRQRRREAASRRVTERELSALHHKIDKLLSKLEESEPDPPTSQEDECVICINARATMQTSPCGHRVVCRRCFVKTIQSAVAQRLLPLRCVICRARVNRLTSSSGTWRIQESASSYSMGAKSWASAGVTAGGVTASASSYSMNDAHSGHHSFHQTTLHHASGGAVPRFPRSPHARVTQSDSLYSMSSTGSSTLSGYSHTSAYSKTSSMSSSGLCSPASPLSPGLAHQTTGSVAGATASTSASVLNNHLAPPSPTTQQQHHHHLSISHPHHHHHSLSSPSGSSAGSLSPREPHSHHHGTCPSGCSGAVPRKPLHTLQHATSTSGPPATMLPPTLASPQTPILTHTYPGRRHTKGRLMDLQNRLPPIKEFRSPAKVPHPSPVHISNPRFRYASYTKTSTQELAPLLREPPSPPRRPMNIQMSCASLSGLAPPPLKAGGAKICPLSTKASMPKNAYLMPKDKKQCSSGGGGSGGNNGGACSGSTSSKCGSAPTLVGSAKGQLASGKHASTAEKAANTAKTSMPGTSGSGGGGGGSGSGRKQTLANNGACVTHSSASSRSFPLFSSNNHKEKADNKKNESVERKKREEKLKLKAEKEARKEEKRLAKEEERLAKLLAKEEKKKGKKEAKELLLANDGNNKK